MMSHSKSFTYIPRSLLRTALMSAAILGFSNNANAEDIFESLHSEVSTPATTAPHINAQSKIAIARLDGGRLIPAPYGELEDWTFLNKRTAIDIIPLTAGQYIKYTPEIPFTGQDTDNKIDEIRLTAANEGMEFTLIYAVGPDADIELFGHRSLAQTGLTLSPSTPKWGQAKARAILMNSHSGAVLGMVTAENVDYNIGELADRAGALITSLSFIKTASRTTISG